MEPPVDLERFATLSAELDAGTRRDELCAREGISLADWNASQEAWLSRLAEETARKRFVLTNRYNNAFVARRRALTHGPRFPAQKPAAAKKVDPAAPPPMEIAPPPPVVVSLPGLRREAEPPPVYLDPEYLDPEYLEPEPPPRRAAKPATMSMPAFTEPAAAPLPFVPALDASGLECSTVTGVSPIPRSHVALPFKAAAPADGVAAPAAVSRPVESVDTGTLRGTSPGAALPFHRAAPPPAAPVAVAPVAPPRSELNGGSTVYGLVSPFAAQGPALPFQGGAPAAPAPRAALSQSSMGLPFHAKAAPTPAAAAPPGAQAGSPAARPAPTGQGTTRLTLEQFASLTAEIAVSPRDLAQIRARYGFDEASHRAEAEEHNRRFTADQALYARYMELFQSYREWVARTPR